MSLNIQDAVAEVNAMYDWTGIREGGFHFGATRVQATGWDGDSYRWCIGTGKTAAEAFADLRKEIPTGADRAKKLRDNAAKLLAEAEAVEATPEVNFP